MTTKTSKTAATATANAKKAPAKKAPKKDLRTDAGKLRSGKAAAKKATTRPAPKAPAKKAPKATKKQAQPEAEFVTAADGNLPNTGTLYRALKNDSLEQLRALATTYAVAVEVAGKARVKRELAQDLAKAMVAARKVPARLALTKGRRKAASKTGGRVIRLPEQRVSTTLSELAEWAGEHMDSARKRDVGHMIRNVEAGAAQLPKDLAKVTDEDIAALRGAKLVNSKGRPLGLEAVRGFVAAYIAFMGAGSPAKAAKKAKTS